MHETVEFSTMTSTTPLLLLLDSILSQEADRIRDARTRIRSVVSKAATEKDDPTISPDRQLIITAALQAAAPIDGPASVQCLLQDIDLLLTAFPQLASKASGHDGSLPLHFAASMGNVEVARRIFDSVSFLCLGNF